MTSLTHFKANANDLYVSRTSPSLHHHPISLSPPSLSSPPPFLSLEADDDSPPPILDSLYTKTVRRGGFDSITICEAGTLAYCMSVTDAEISAGLCEDAYVFQGMRKVTVFAITPTRFITFPTCVVPYLSDLEEIYLYNVILPAPANVGIDPLARFGAGLKTLVLDNSFVTTTTGEHWSPDLNRTISTYPALSVLNITNTFLNTDMFTIAAPASLTSLTLTNTSITGTIAPSIAANVPSTSIRWDLSNNKLSGSLPSTFHLSSVANTAQDDALLDLSDNNLLGTIPSSFLSSLASEVLNASSFSFSVAGNRLSGKFDLSGLAEVVPSGFGGLKLNIANNDFSDLSIDDSWSIAISSLDLSNNLRLAMGTNFSDALFGPSSILKSLNASHTRLSGVLPNMGVLGAPMLSELDLGCALDIDLCGGSGRSVWTSSTLTSCVLASTAIDCPSLYPSICSVSNCTYYAVPEEDPISEPIVEPVTVPVTSPVVDVIPMTTPVVSPVSAPVPPMGSPTPPITSPISPSPVAIPSNPIGTPSPVSSTPSKTLEPTGEANSLHFGSQTVILLIGMIVLVWVLL